MQDGTENAKKQDCIKLNTLLLAQIGYNANNETKNQYSGIVRKVVISMTQHKIFLRHDEVKEFVKRASACDFDIDISYNHYTVDAKSILGVLALDFRQALTVCCHGYDEGFEKYLGKYAMAC